MANDKLIAALKDKYSLGFSVELEHDTIPKGLNEGVIELLSTIKKEPKWLLEWRLTAFKHWLTLTEPSWANVHHEKIDYQNLSYYSAPKKVNQERKDIDPDLLAYYEKLGVPLNEREILAGNIAVDAVLDSVSVGTTFKDKLDKAGVIFCSFSEAVQKYPDLVQQYLGSVVSYKDNYFASLNSAVFSDGSFCFIPKGVKCPMELSTYFRINQAQTGQFERTLIIAEEGASVRYLEGCFLAGSSIWTPQGIKKIESLLLNDEVYDYQGHVQHVKALMVRPYKGDIYSIFPANYQYPICATHEHPFWVKTHEHQNAQWINAKNLNEGDFIFMPHIVADNFEINRLLEQVSFDIKDSNGYWIKIEKINKQYQKTLVYNFEVSNTNTYLVQGIAVHNCSAPSRPENQLHAAVVELVALEKSKIEYSTVQNWYPGDENGKGGIYNFVTKRGECRGDDSEISWTQIETGSAITWKYPSVILRGKRSKGYFYSVALTNHYQQADTGTKMIHLGEYTSSTIIAKSISAGKSVSTYRGLVRIAKKAKKARNFTQCDSLIFGQASVHTDPYIENSCYDAKTEHEATTSPISDEHLFYLMQHGLSEEQAKNMLVNGFCKSVFQKLPGEFAVEAQKLLEINLEGSMG